MQDYWSSLAVLLAALATPVYLHAFVKFHALVRAEHPEWVERKGSLSFMYEGLPRAFEPNVSLAVLRIAFGQKAMQLVAPQAAGYARRIRVLLPAGLFLYLVALVLTL